MVAVSGEHHGHLSIETERPIDAVDQSGFRIDHHDLCDRDFDRHD